jgi:hypothetical protein
MSIEKLETLNSIYKPLQERVKSIVNKLKSNNYNCEWGYFGQHYIKHNNNWLVEYFPIPVIDVIGICEIGIDLEHIFIEYKILKQTALKYDFNKLIKCNFEVYGVENYLNDFYNAKMDLNDINSRILESEEKEVGISIFLDSEASLEDILNAVKNIELIS